MLGLMKQLGSERGYSKSHQGWNVINKDLFLPALIVGSYTKATHEWAPAAWVTWGQYVL